MDNLDAPRLMTADPIRDQPARFDPEDLVHLRALLGDASPRPSAAEHSTIRQDARQPEAATALTREEKQREKYRHRYRHRITKISRLKDEVAALEATVRKLSNGAEEVEDGNGFSLPIDLPLTPGTTREAMIGNLHQASSLKQQLQRERAQLRQQFIESCDRWRHIKNLVVMHHKLYVATESSFVMVEPLAIPECAQIREIGLKMRAAFLQRHSQLNESICGWSAARCMEDRVLQYSIKKTYFNRSVDFFAPIAWRLYSDPNLNRSMYSAALEMQVRVVQLIDRNSIVMLNEYIETGVDGERIKVKILWLLTQAWTESGYLIGIHNLGGERLKFLEHPQPMSSNERIVWNDAYFSWVHYERGGAKGEHTIIHVSGCIRPHGKEIGFWYKQFYPVLIRWDTIALGARFSIPKQ